MGKNAAISLDRWEWLYWEGRAQLAASHPRLGARALERFLLEAPESGALVALRADARKWLAH